MSLSTALFGGQSSEKFDTVKTTAGFGSSFGGGPTGSVLSTGFGFQSQTTVSASPGMEMVTDAFICCLL